MEIDQRPNEEYTPKQKPEDSHVPHFPLICLPFVVEAELCHPLTGLAGPFLSAAQPSRRVFFQILL